MSKGTHIWLPYLKKLSIARSHNVADRRMKCAYGALLLRQLREKSEVHGEKSVPVPIFPSQIQSLHGDRLRNNRSLNEDWNRDSSVGIATRYGLDVHESNPGGGRDFPHPSRPALVPPPSLLYNGYRVFPGRKVAEVMKGQSYNSTRPKGLCSLL